MRIFLLSAAAIALLAAIAAIAAPWLVDRQFAQDRVRTWIANLTDGQLQVDGRIDLTVIPTPRLVIDDPVIRPTEQDTKLGTIVADRLDLDLTFGALLKGRIEIRDAKLIRPDIMLDTSFENLLSGLSRVVAGKGRVAARSISMADGTISLINRDDQFTNIDANLSVNAATGQSKLAATARSGAADIDINVQLGALLANRPTSLKATGTVVIQGATTLARYSGVMTPNDNHTAVEGEFSIGAEKLSSIAAWWSPGILEASPISLDADEFALEGKIEFDGRLWRMQNAIATINEQVIQGSLDYVLGNTPELNAELRSADLKLSEKLINSDSLYAAIDQLPSQLTGAISARLDKVSWRNGVFDQIRLTSQLGSNRQLTIEQLRIGLPGAGTAQFEGELTADNAGLTALGHLELSTRDVRHLLTVFGYDVSGLSQDIRHVNFSGNIEANPDSYGAYKAELRVDATKATGDILVIKGATPRVSAAFVIDRIQLDRLLLREPDPGNISSIVGSIAPYDSHLDIQINRLNWLGSRLENVKLIADSLDGIVTINEASVRNVAGTSISLTGRAVPKTDTFEFASRINIISPIRLIRAVVDNPPPITALLRPISIAGTLTGTKGELGADMVFEGDAYAGTIKLVSSDDIGSASFDAEINIVSDDLQGVLSEFEDLSESEPLLNGGADIQLRLSSQKARLHSTQILASLGRIAVEVDLSASENSCLGGSVSIGPISTGLMFRIPHWLAPDISEREPFEWGNWPETMPDLTWLTGASCQNDVNVLLDNGNSINLNIVRDPGMLFVENANLNLDVGRLTGSASLEMSQEKENQSHFGGSIRLEDGDLGAILTELGIDHVIDGDTNTFVDLSSSGSTIADMVRSLQGDGTMAFRDLQLGAPKVKFGDGQGEIVIENGILFSDIQSLEPRDTKADQRLRVVVDLPNWMLEATLSGNTSDTRYWLGSLNDVKELVPTP